MHLRLAAVVAAVALTSLCCAPGDPPRDGGVGGGGASSTGGGSTGGGSAGGGSAGGSSAGGGGGGSAGGGSAGGSSGACSLVGVWTGTLVAGPFAGQTVTWTFGTGGASTASFGTSSVTGTWAVAGNIASLTDTSSTPASIACMANVIGRYSLAFAASCNEVTFTRVDDTCDGRRFAVEGVRLTR